jgi:TPR repeat protein
MLSCPFCWLARAQCKQGRGSHASSQRELCPWARQQWRPDVRELTGAEETHGGATRRSVSCACVVLVFAAFLCVASHAAYAQATPCDRLAGSPIDPNKVTPGVPFRAIKAKEAVAACEAAIETDGNNPRLWYELGLALVRLGAYADAVSAYRKAADQGYAAAEDDLGGMYVSGRGVPNDDSQAIAWFRKAADQGYAEAQKDLGEMYAAGRGTAKDDAQALALFRRAAAQGNAGAEVDLGGMYANGIGVAKDGTQAVALFRKAAAKGNAEGEKALGEMYYAGVGVRKDDAQACAWFRKAADQGLAGAQFALGIMYAEGFGVAKDHPKAAFWFRKAATQGYAPAQAALDELQGKGQALSSGSKGTQ